MSRTGCASTTDIYKNHSLNITIKIGGIQVSSGTQLLMGDTINFFMGYSIGIMNPIVQAIPKITVTVIFQKDPQCLIAHPNKATTTLIDLKG